MKETRDLHPYYVSEAVQGSEGSLSLRGVLRQVHHLDLHSVRRTLPDLILNMFAILRQRFNLQPSATMPYNVEQMVSVFHDALRPRTLRLPHPHVVTCPEKEVPIGDVIKMGIKYPLMFYALSIPSAHAASLRRRQVLGGADIRPKEQGDDVLCA